MALIPQIAGESKKWLIALDIEAKNEDFHWAGEINFGVALFCRISSRIWAYSMPPDEILGVRINMTSVAFSSKSLLENKTPNIGISFKKGTPLITARSSDFLIPPITRLLPGAIRFSETSILRSVIIEVWTTPSGLDFEPS